VWIEIIRSEKHPYKRLKDLNIQTIIDIWANEWQFLSTFMQIFPNTHYHCFEPLSDAFKILQHDFWNKANIQLYNTWLWADNSVVSINKSEYNPSSSLLEMSDTHKTAFPHTSNSVSEQITIKKLDDYSINGENLLIKIDTQWYELEIMKGGTNTIRNAKVCIIETSVVELYNNQPLFDEIYEFMKNLWFEYRWAYDQLKNPHDWSVLQQDVIFIKKIIKKNV